MQRQTAAGFHAALVQRAYVNVNPLRGGVGSLDVATRGHESSRISCGPFCYWNLMIRHPRGAPLHKYLRGKSLRRSTCLLSPPLVLTTVPPFPRTLSFYYADLSLAHSAHFMICVLTVSGPALTISRR